MEKKFTSVALRIVVIVLTGFCLQIIPLKTSATHMAGADLTFQHLGNNLYRFNYTFYRDCVGISAQSSFPLMISSAACNISTSITLLPLPGTGQEISYTCSSALTTCRGGNAPGIQKWEYSGTYTLPAQCPDWTFGVSGCCRNAAITTIVNPDSYNLYIQATLNNVGQDNNSPFFSNVPIAFECINQNNFYNHGVIDLEGDSLTYTFVNPMDAQNILLTYASGYSVANPITSVPGVNINPVTGDVFMHPVAPEVGVIAVLIREYRNGVLISTVMRDIQIYTIQCNNQLPVASGINGTNVFTASICSGNPLCFDVLSSDLNVPDSVTMFWNFGINGATFTTTGNYRPTGRFCWTPSSSDVRAQPHTFVVTVRDNACPSNGVQSFAYLIYVGELNTQLTASPTVSCNGGHNGFASISAVGSGPYQYLWLPGEFITPTVSHLSPGNYSVTVVDTLGCAATRYFTISEPPPLQLSINSTDVGCNGSLGSAEASAGGGTGPYTYSWNTTPVQLGPQANDLTADTYTVIVRDANNCRISGNVTIEDAIPVTATISSTPASCNAADGTVDVNVQGGSGAFSYIWSPNVSNSSSAQNLYSGLYEVTVLDDSTGCSIQLSTLVNNSSGIVASIISSTDATCQNGEDGSALASGSGGSAPYTYLWMPTGANTAFAQQLEPGIHTVAVSDYDGCTGYAQVEIMYQLPAPLVDLGADTIVCTGTSFTLDAGPGGTDYLWSDNSTAQTLTVQNSGIYSVLVRDQNGCEAFDAIEVNFISCQKKDAGHPVLNDQLFSLFPNPSAGSVSIIFDQSAGKAVKFQLTDLTGKLLGEQMINLIDKSVAELDLSALSPGVYFIRCTDANVQQTSRLIRF